MRESGARRPTIAAYVSGHGFGHAVRSAEVVRELLERGARVVVRTEAPEWLFPRGAEMLRAPAATIDVGVAQVDGLEMDVEETRCRWDAFAKVFETRAEEEAAALARAEVDLVLGDIPPLAFAAGARAGVPSVALGNFGWDWIYAGLPGLELAAARVRSGYARANLLLRLPFASNDADAFPAFRAIEDVPLIARIAVESRDATRRRLGIPATARAILLSFGGFDATRLDLSGLGAWPSYLFVLTPLSETPASVPRNVLILPRLQVDYPALVAACDAIVTKPGYGIVADCLANRVPVLFTDRGPFREYPVLAEALETLGTAAYVAREDVRSGRLGPHLDALLGRRARWAPLDADGASRVADRLLRMVAASAEHTRCRERR